MDKIAKALAMLAWAGPEGVTWEQIEAAGYTRSVWHNTVMPMLGFMGYGYVSGDGGTMLRSGPGIDP